MKNTRLNGYGNILAALFIFIATGVPVASAQKKAKNVILLIGDGMGPQQYAMVMNYARLAPQSKIKKLNLERLLSKGEMGLMLTYAKDAIVVDSAASATQLSLGLVSGSEMIGLDYKGNSHKTILEKARDAGKATGLVSDTRLTHATPAAFAAHQPHRSWENEIAADMLKANVDIMLSAGLRNFIPSSVNELNSPAYAKYKAIIPKHIPLGSKRKDKRDLLEEAKKSGYSLAFDRQTLLTTKSTKILGLFDSAEMPNGIAEFQSESNPNRPHPTLNEMARVAIDKLSQDKDGFFLMIEAGQIDWAAHANDAGTMLHQLLQFDKTIGYVLDWAEKDGDTLVVLTADHETGSFGFSYSSHNVPEPQKIDGDGFKNAKFSPNYNFGPIQLLDKLYNQKKSYTQVVREFEALGNNYQTPEKFMKMVNEVSDFAISLDDAKQVLAPLNGKYYVHDFKDFYVYEENHRENRLARVLARQQNIVWGTGTHTATPVAVTAFGPKHLSSQFKGIHHSSEVGAMLQSAMGL